MGGKLIALKLMENTHFVYDEVCVLHKRRNNLEQLSQENVDQRVRRAIDRLTLCDAELLRIDCNERSITHRLAIYLQNEFEGWNVDCEYKRDCHSPDYVKRLLVDSDSLQASLTIDDTDANTVYPDIIVHYRGTSDNLLVIEVKKSRNQETDTRDEKKLHAFKKELQYQYALFLRFNTGRDFQEGLDPVRRLEWI